MFGYFWEALLQYIIHVFLKRKIHRTMMVILWLDDVTRDRKYYEGKHAMPCHAKPRHAEILVGN